MDIIGTTPRNWIQQGHLKHEMQILPLQQLAQPLWQSRDA